MNSGFRVDSKVREAIRWRDSWGKRLVEKYAGNWIAIRGKRVVAVGRTYGDLAKKLRSLRLGPVHISREEAPAVVMY